MTVKSLLNFYFHKPDTELILPDQTKLLKCKAITINHNGCMLGIFALITRNGAIVVDRPSYEETFNTTRTILKSVAAHHKRTLDRKNGRLSAVNPFQGRVSGEYENLPRDIARHLSSPEQCSEGTRFTLGQGRCKLTALRFL
jgi:hypothetical protein